MSPTPVQSSTEDEEVTFYDFKTGYFITFLAKKSGKLTKAIEELKEIESQVDQQKKRQEIVEIIMTTPPGPGEEQRSKIKGLGRLRGKLGTWEEPRAPQVHTNKSLMSGNYQQIPTLLNTENLAGKLNQELHNPTEKLTTTSFKEKQQFFKTHDLAERSHRPYDQVTRPGKGHEPVNALGHDLVNSIIHNTV